MLFHIKLAGLMLLRWQSCTGPWHHCSGCSRGGRLCKWQVGISSSRIRAERRPDGDEMRLEGRRAAGKTARGQRRMETDLAVREAKRLDGGGERSCVTTDSRQKKEKNMWPECICLFNLNLCMMFLFLQNIFFLRHDVAFLSLNIF